MKRNHLLVWFQMNYPELVQLMHNCQHHYDSQHLNGYHLEGSVWTHTLMALNNNITYDLNIELAILLHDIGKCYTRFHNKDTLKVSFLKHAAISTYKAIDILFKFKSDNPNIPINIIKILKIINLHDHLIQATPLNVDKILSKFQPDIELIESLILMTICDSMGRFNIIESTISVTEWIQILQRQREVTLNLFEKKPVPVLHKAEVILLMGIPNSGKTTYLENNKDRYSNYEVVSYDNTLIDRNPEMDYDNAFQSADHDALRKEVNLKLQNLTKDFKNVIIDMTNCSPKSRNRKLSQFSNKHYSKKIIVFLVGESEFKKRNTERSLKGKTIPPEIENLMSSNFIFPLPMECDAIEYVMQ